MSTDWRTAHRIAVTPSDYRCAIVLEQRPPHLDITLRDFRFGAQDPTCRWRPGCFERALLTPEGPGVIRVTTRSEHTVEVDATGEGSEWLVTHASDILGLTDVIPEIEPAHEVVGAALRRHLHVRLGRSLVPYHELLTSVLGQRITAMEATRQWARLVGRFGSTAPGDSGLLVPPEPALLEALPYHALHEIGIERSRAERLISVARHVHRLSPLGTGNSVLPADATRQLTMIPGVGQWTAAVAGGLAYGDADALRVGDFHVKNVVAWALDGRPRGTDEEMVRMMEPYAGQRHRVVRCLLLDGWSAPRRGPRRPILEIRHL